MSAPVYIVRNERGMIELATELEADALRVIAHAAGTPGMEWSYERYLPAPTVAAPTNAYWHKCDAECRHCTLPTVEYDVVDSPDGAFTDYHYRCTTCKRDWWVDGIDS